MSKSAKISKEETPRSVGLPGQSLSLTFSFVICAVEATYYLQWRSENKLYSDPNKA